jgi:hypothetical protein
MRGIRFRSYQFWIFLLFVALCVPASAAANARQELIWPVHTTLVRNLDNAVGTWTPVGDVAIWNTKDTMTVDIVPFTGYTIAKVGVHVVSNPADFAAILDKKGKPDFKYFQYVKEYKPAANSHRQLVDLSTLNLCWSPDTTKCPNNRYVVAAVELQGSQERAYAKNGGVFDRFTGGTGEGIAWGYYITYPIARVEPGHFVDANVNGLTYRTPSQSGVTGEQGQFWFLRGERVNFWVGALPLGGALGDRAVSPMDLFPGADLEDDRVLNVARLLQSFDADGNPGHGAINITEPVISCLNRALTAFTLPGPEIFFADDALVSAVISATISSCDVPLSEVSREEALENLTSGMKGGNLMKRNVSKTPGAKSDKAQIEILPVYVPAKRSDGALTQVTYHNADGEVIEMRSVAKPIAVSYVDEVEGTGAMDVFIAISRDDGDTWKRRNISRTADKSSLLGYPGHSWKPQMKVYKNMIFVAWSDKYCRGGRPGYSITVCPDTDGDGSPDPCEICRETADGTVCTPDYQGDDAYWQDDIFGVGGPQRTVTYPDHPDVGEVPYSCVWAARGLIDAAGDVKWFKPERLTSGRRDAFQLTAASGDDVAFALVWQEHPKGLLAGEGDGPGEGWGGANTNNKTDIWYSYIRISDFALVDANYPTAMHRDGDFVDTDAELAGRAKALVPMSLPVKITDNDICSYENILALGGGEHTDGGDGGDGEGTHRYCGTIEGIGSAEHPGTNPLCAYTVAKANPKGEIHNVCVTSDGRLLDGNTGASRPNINVQPYGTGTGRSAWVIIAYEESKGVGIPPDGEHDEDEGCGGEETGDSTDEHEKRYKPDTGKNVIYHSFNVFNPETVAGGDIVNLPETDAAGNPVYLVDEFGELLLDWKNEPQLAYENARRVRLLPQSPGKASASDSKTSLAIIYRQGAEGSGKPADIFLRRLKMTPGAGNPYSFRNVQSGAQNLSSVTPTVTFQDPFDDTKPLKMLRWSWTPANLDDLSSKNPHTDAHAHRGALVGDDLIIAYTLTPNWGRKGNDKYDLYVRRSFDGGRTWTTDPDGAENVEHSVATECRSSTSPPKRSAGSRRWLPRRTHRVPSNRRGTSRYCATTARACSSRDWSRHRGRS